MPTLTEANLKVLLGNKFDAEADYKIARQSDVLGLRGRGYTLVDGMKDATGDKNGFMAVMAKSKPAKLKAKVPKKVAQ